MAQEEKGGRAAVLKRRTGVLVQTEGRGERKERFDDFCCQWEMYFF